ncbi:MAG: hypothetical protein UZ17_ACD001002116 [Acidobacteria bacterium OLB17]|nr:MAG: hypothetical protein UZ17_ACD001002116 [Acidobacteria bacterium OLB17]MCZ2389855.1 PDZ domain-containing protein [Acidobacteriota bacterium]
MNREPENIDLDRDAEIADLLKAMPYAEPPKDFEFRVSARIASARTAAKPRGLLGALRIAIPAAALLAVTGTVFVLNPYLAETDVVSKPAETGIASDKGPMTDVRPAVPERAAEIPPTTFASNGPAIESPRQRPEDQLLASRSHGPSNDETGGTSFVESGTQGVKLYPSGIDPNAGAVRQSDGLPQKGIAIRDILAQLGLTLGGGLRVNAVNPNGIAERSGVRLGDVIESLNGQAITDETMLFGTVTARRIGVRRDGRLVELSLGR